MGKWSDSLLGSGGAAPEQEQQQDEGQPKKKWSESLLGSGAEAQVIEPRIQTGVAAGPMGRTDIKNEEFFNAESPPVSAHIKAGLVDDPDTKRKVYARSIFPDLSEAEALQRVSILPGGDIAYQAPEDGKWRRVDAITGKKILGEFVANFPAIALGTVGSTATGPGGVGLAALGTAGGEGWRKFLGGLIYNEPQTMGGNALDMAKEGVIGGVAEGATRGIISVGNKAAQATSAPGAIGKLVAPDVRSGAVNQARAAETMDKAQTLGVDLPPVAAADSPTGIGLYKDLKGLPGPAKNMIRAQEQNVIKPQLEDAVYKTLEKVSPGAARTIETGSKQGVKAASKIRETMVKAREAAASPLYKDALKNASPVDTSDTMSVLAKWADQAGEGTDMARAVDGVRKKLLETIDVGGRKMTAMKSRADQLHMAKVEIDTFFDKNPKLSADKFVQRMVEDVKISLQSDLNRATGGKYMKASKAFERLSQPINDFDKSILGKIAGLEGDEVVTAGRKLFAREWATPETIKRAKDLMIKYGMENDWKAISRAYLTDAFERTAQAAEGASSAIKWRNAFLGKPREKAKLAAMLNPRQFKAFEDLIDVLGAAAKLSDFNSDTAYKLAGGKKLVEAAGGLRAKIADWAGSRISPKQYAEFTRNRAYPDFSAKLAAAVLDPNGIKSIQRLRTLKPSTERWWRILENIVTIGAGTVGSSAAEQRLSPGSRQPISLTQPATSSRPQLAPKKGAKTQ